MDRAGSRAGHWYLVRVGRVDAEGELVVDIGDTHLAAFGPPDGDDHVLADGHGQHRVALVVDVLPDQIHPPCSNSQSQPLPHSSTRACSLGTGRDGPGERAKSAGRAP